MQKEKCPYVFKIKRSNRREGTKCGKPVCYAKYASIQNENGEIVGHYCRKCAINQNYNKKKKEKTKKTKKIEKEKKTKKNNREFIREKRSKRILKNSNKITQIKKITKPLKNKNKGTNKKKEAPTKEVVTVAVETFRYFGSHLYANCLVSLNASENILSLLEEEKMIEKGLSRTTISRTVVESANICLHVIAEVLPLLEDLVVSIDESPKHNGRCFDAIILSGNLPKNNIHWYFNKAGIQSFTVGFIECYNKTAEQFCTLIEKTLFKFQQLQKELRTKTKEISFLDIYGVSADWTNSNSGQHKGLVKLIDIKKKKIDPKAPNTKFEGCNDHLISLIPKNFILKTLPSLLEKHNVNSPLPSMSSLLNHLAGFEKTKFNGFVLKNFGLQKKVRIEKVNETRYCSFPISSKCFIKNKHIFLAYLKENSVDKCKLEDLTNKFGIQVIRMLAKTAESFFLPFMKKVAQINDIQKYKFFIEENLNQLKETLLSTKSYKIFWNLGTINEEDCKDLDEFHNLCLPSINNSLKKIGKSKDTKGMRSSFFKDKDYIYNKVELGKPQFLFYLLTFEWTLDTIVTIEQKTRIIFKNNSDDNENCYIKTTNRDCEGTFSIFNRFFEKNGNLNTLIAQSIFIIRSTTKKSYANLKKIIKYYSREEEKYGKTWYSKVISVSQDQLSCYGNATKSIEAYESNQERVQKEKKKQVFREWCALFIVKNKEENKDEQINLSNKDFSFASQENPNNLSHSQSKVPQTQITLDKFLTKNAFPKFDSKFEQCPITIFKQLSTKKKKSEKEKNKKKKNPIKKNNFVTKAYKCYQWMFSKLSILKIVKGAPTKKPRKNDEMIQLFLQTAKLYHSNFFPNTEFIFGNSDLDNSN